MNTLEDIKNHFNESLYLKLNPGVAKGVQTKAFVSGWEHYIQHGFRENRPGVSAEIQKQVQKIQMNDFSDLLPPQHLRSRVHGTKDPLGFKNVGKLVTSNLYDTLKTTNFSLTAKSCVLDFGCGCGRIIIHLHKLLKNASFYGTDIDNEAILWCQDKLSKIGEFSTNKELPPLIFEDAFFDFVYSTSVFTHLPEDMQFLWLEELKRITKPQGYLFLTVQGKELLLAKNVSLEKKEQLQETGFLYDVSLKTDAFPSFYQMTFHTEEYIYEQWSKFFKVEKIIKHGGHQDLVICRL